MSRIRLSRVEVAVVGASLLLAACSSNGSVSEGEDGTETVSIAVTQWPSLVFAVPYHVAMEEGYFEEEGIAIEEVIATQGGGTTVRSILAGDLAFGETSTASLVESEAAGAELVAVGAGVQAVADILWVAPPASELQSIEDLTGRVVGFTNPGGVTQSVLAMSIDRAGLDPATVDMRATGGVSEGLTAMEGGGVDATIHSEPLFSENPDAFRVLWRASDLITAYQQTVIVTSPELAESNPELVRGFLSARARAVEYMKENPEEAARIWSERGDVELTAAQSAIASLLAADEWGVGFSVEGLEAAEEGMLVAGLLEDGDTVSWESLINQSLLPEGVESVELP